MNRAETATHGEKSILLVEDNPADVRITLEAFKEGKIEAQIFIVKDGVEALNFLERKEKFSNEPLPDIILLDLNLPRKDGREVLEEIKKDPGLKSIPAIILTSSKAEEDIQKSYQLHCNCYLTKPVGLNEFETLINLLNDFWLKVVELPSKFI